MESDDPYAQLGAELDALEGAAADFFAALASGLPKSTVAAAVKTGSVGALYASRAWKVEVGRLLLAVRRVEIDLATAGFLQGAAEVPGGAPALSARIGYLAEQLAGARSVQLAQAIDLTTRQGLRLAIGRASREYANDQGLSTLRELEAEIRSMVGLTPKQATRIEAWRTAAVDSGMDPAAVEAGVAGRSEAAVALRARAIADSGVVESVSAARHQSWVEARRDGDLPRGVKKVWQTQGDKRVRPLHRAQERAGPIPLDAVYSIMGVVHPPSKDFGCRCWERLLVPAGGGA